MKPGLGLDFPSEPLTTGPGAKSFNWIGLHISKVVPGLIMNIGFDASKMPFSLTIFLSFPVTSVNSILASSAPLIKAPAQSGTILINL